MNEIQEAADYVAITRMQQKYADIANRRAWAELERLFTPDCVITLDLVTRDPLVITGPRELGDFIGGSIERFAFFQFVILTTHLDLDADQASGRMWMSELRLEAGTRQPSQIFGLYQDRYQRTETGWRFARRDYRSIARTDGMEVFDLPKM